MIMSDDYYGLFNDKIHFYTQEIKKNDELTENEKNEVLNGNIILKPVVKLWWDEPDEEKNTKKTCYNISKDYDSNIKNIIINILNRNTIKYKSLLISEEKFKNGHFTLVNKILNDFPNLFIIIFHGNCLRLYLSKQYEQEIKRLSSTYRSTQKPSSFILFIITEMTSEDTFSYILIYQ
jgi:hypothetical protein